MNDQNESRGVAARQDPTVDDYAEALGKRLALLKSSRADARAQRDGLNAHLKVLDAEIDKAERMTKALIPRTRKPAARTGGV